MKLKLTLSFFCVTFHKCYSFAFYLWVYDSFWVKFCERHKVSIRTFFPHCSNTVCWKPNPFSIQPPLFLLKICWLHLYRSMFGSWFCSTYFFVLSPIPHCCHCCCSKESLDIEYFPSSDFVLLCGVCYYSVSFAFPYKQ